jgi:hypothetical protein
LLFVFLLNLSLRIEAAFCQESYFTLFHTWLTSQPATTRAVAVGDVNGDGYLDLVCGNDGQSTTLYLNQGGVLQTTPAWSSLLPSKTTSVALGDIDGDGDLDLVCGNNGDKTTLYLNDGGVFQMVPAWFSGSPDYTYAVALGDMDNDGDLDLVCGNDGESTLYVNDGGVFRNLPGWYSIGATTRGLALGDIDGDSDLDVVFANAGRSNTAYLNDGGVLQSSPSWLLPNQTSTQQVALGDIDGDGDLDLVCGNSSQTSKLYLNDGGTLQTLPAWSSSSQADQTTSVVLGDVDGDGDLDLVFGNSGQSARLYISNGGVLETAPAWSSGKTDDNTQGVALGDADVDGDLDLICGNLYEPTRLYSNISGALKTTAAWAAAQTNMTTSVVLGNIGGDGDLDLVCGNLNQSTTIYPNDEGVLQIPPLSLNIANTNSVALGDIDGDGDFDLVRGNNGGKTAVHLNDGGVLPTEASWETEQSSPTTSVALGDVDNDGDLDLVCGNSGQPTELFRNDGGALQTSPSWSSVSAITNAVALGDIDRDGDLDLVCGNALEKTVVYLNDGTTFGPSPAWLLDPLTDNTTSIALGDIDGDGDLDLVCGNDGQSSRLYFNNSGVLETTASWSAAQSANTKSVALGDVDGDSDLDLVCGNFNQISTVFVNDGGTLQTSPTWSLTGSANTRAVALGDVEGDGDLDIVCGVFGDSTIFFSGKTAPVFKSNPLSPANHLPNNGAHLRFVRVENESASYHRIHFTARDVESDRIWVVPEYQYKGESVWYPAIIGGGAAKAGPFAASPAGVRDSIEWDTHLLDFDRPDVVLRLRVVEIPTRVSVIQHIAPYVKEVGSIEPYRPMIATNTSALTFSTVTLGDTTAVPFVIRNAGNLPLEITGFAKPSQEMRIDKVPPFTLLPGERDTCTCFLEPRTETSIGGTIGILSDDPLVPSHTVQVVTDIRALTFDSKLLGSAEKIPLGEAVTVEVTPAPQVHLEKGSVHYRAGGHADGFPGEAPLVTSVNEFIAVIPGGDVTEAGLEYYVSVENSGVIATDPPGAPEAFFTQAVQGPTAVVSTPRPNSSLGFASGTPIYVDVALAQGTSVVDGFIHFRIGGKSEYQTVGPSFIDPSPIFVLPDTAAGPRGIEYWVEVQTLTSTLTDPSSNPQGAPHTIQVTVQNLEESSVSPGNAYRMISIPLEMANVGTITLEALLSDQAEFGPYDPYRWRSFRWASAAEGYMELSDPSAADHFRPRAGSAFWIASKGSNKIATSPVIGYSTGTSDPFTLVLSPGWNMIGDPYDFAVSWDSVLVDGQTMEEAEGVLVDSPIEWIVGQGYAPDDVRVLEPFHGYWVMNLTDADVTLEIPPREVEPLLLAAASKDRGPLVADAADTWQVTIRAETSKDATDANVVGVSPLARPGRDRMDRSEPPMSPGSAISLYSMRGAEYLARDIRCVTAQPEDESSDGEIWFLDIAKSFSTSAAGDVVRIEVEGLGQIPEDAKVYLVDRVLDHMSDLRVDAVYECVVGVREAISDEEEARFALLVGSEEFVEAHRENLPAAPTQTVLHQNHPNPFNPTTVIRYEVASAGHVAVKVFDVSGALVKVVEDREREPGRYEVSWNGRNERGEQVSSGVYFYVLETPGTRQTKKMVCVK